MTLEHCKPPEGGDVNHNPPDDPFVSLNIEHIEVSSEGIHIKSDDLARFQMNAGSKVRCLMQPGYMVITNLPGKLKTLDAIEELQYRQDEIKRDFKLPISQLARLV